jgi:hypothetical protein
MFCDEEHLAEWLFSRLRPVTKARLLDDVIPRTGSDERQPLWYNNG